MNNQSSQSPLGPDDAFPVRTLNPAGTSSFLFLGDHAGNAVPAPLAPFGVSDADMVRHIAWDIGVARLGACLAAAFDATFISQRYSRLVIDCNREPSACDAVPEVSDGTPLPRNATLSEADRAARVAAIHMPYHAAIATELAGRDAAGRETILISLHSFTPTMQGMDRPLHVGVLHNGGNDGFARAVLAGLLARNDQIVGDNAPYAMDAIDYTIPRHAFPAGRPYVEMEVRQDLLATESMIVDWAKLLQGIFAAAR